MESSKTAKPKAKLPRKRKKAAIKAQGREWYHHTIKLFNLLESKGQNMEKVCKFWDNSSVSPTPTVINNKPAVLMMARRFW